MTRGPIRELVFDDAERPVVDRLQQRDGTSQRRRALAALDPASVKLDGRTTRDLLAFVQAFAGQLRYLRANGRGGIEAAGTWSSFAERADISLDDVVAFLEDPTREGGARADWLGRPHFGLLLVFLELLGNARDQLNDVTRRHLDYYYGDLLGMTLRSPVADRAAVLFGTSPRANKARVAQGTELLAGRDSTGRQRTYRTEREIHVGHASVAQLRSIFVDRQRVGLGDIRHDDALTARQVLDAMLVLALGRDARVDTDVLRGYLALLRFARAPEAGPTAASDPPQLYLDHHELRSLDRLHDRRGRKADAEWKRINTLLGNPSPARPRDFAGNLHAAVGELRFDDDGWPEIDDLDDLFDLRDLKKPQPDGTQRAVRALIEAWFAPLGATPAEAFDAFVELMLLKRRIDSEWNEINRLLERAGRRRRRSFTWRLAPDGGPFDPTAFVENLSRALEGHPTAGEWPRATSSISSYVMQVQAVEERTGLPAERLLEVAAFALAIGDDAATTGYDWRPIDRLLASAHVEKHHAGRRRKLAEARGDRDDREGLLAVAKAALGIEGPTTWDEALAALSPALNDTQRGLLVQFDDDLGRDVRVGAVGWSDAYRIIDLAVRRRDGVVDPIAETVTLKNVYAYADATQVLVDPERSTRWRPFGRKPPAGTPGASLGFAVRSPGLAMRRGLRHIVLTIGFDDERGFDRDRFLRGLGLDLDAEPNPSIDAIRTAVREALSAEISTAKGYWPLDIDKAFFGDGGDGNDDYYYMANLEHDGRRRWPALSLSIQGDASAPPFVPLDPRDGAPTLRICCRQIPAGGNALTTRLSAFEGVVVGAVNVVVGVDGLSDIAIQHEDRVLDPAKPFEPFGSRPQVGTRFYLWDAELVRHPLKQLKLDIAWMGLPKSLPDRYFNYPDARSAKPPPFKAKLSLVDGGVEIPLAASMRLFQHDDGANTTSAELAFSTWLSGPPVTRGSAGDVPRDLRAAPRYFVWELLDPDFGHADYPGAAAAQARELAIKLATTPSGTTAATYRVEPPYTPTIKRLAFSYHLTFEIRPETIGSGDELLHVHPFETWPVAWPYPTLFPSYPDAGELQIGLTGTEPPENLSMWIELAAGSSDPDAGAGRVKWWYGDGASWQPVAPGDVLVDATRGLINSGDVEIALRAAAPGPATPGIRWLKASIDGDVRSACDVIGVHTQAVVARFVDRDNAADHFDAPLPKETIDRLLQPDSRIVSVTQPYASFGSKPAERSDRFHTRVSERLRHKQRALAPWDYERLVLERFPQIYKAKCLRAGTPLSAGADIRTGDVDVVVVPEVRQALPGELFAPKAPADLVADIRAYLTERAPVGVNVRVRNAIYLGVKARLGVRFRPGQDEEQAKRRLREDIVRFLSPWAFDEGADITIGGKIYANSLIDFVDRREYVDYVAKVTLFRSATEGGHPLPVQVTAVDYHVATTSPDQVLVSAIDHEIDVIPESGFDPSSHTGIGYMRIELDFIVG